jgi:fibronectin-binding autotransporter adhesin
MATRYWVGGAGNWSSTAKWSTTSGGSSGASVPTSADDVIFDANSGGKFTATVDTAQSVNSITITPSAAVGVQQIALSARLTTGNLTTTGTAGNNRIWFRGNTYGIAQDFVVNGTVSISDCDFRDIYVIGTAAPISGTRIGDLRGIRGITASTPKTVYWNLAGAQNWSANGWSDTSTGTPNTNFFPLAQDTATFTNAGSVTGTITMNSAVPYTGTVDMSGRTSAMSLSVGAFTVYGNWTNGSGTALSATGALVFSGRNTQTITSAGKTFADTFGVDSYGGTVELADALNIGANTLIVNNGTFDTKNFNVTAGVLSSSNSNVRTISLGSSTVTLSSNTGLGFTTATNLTLNAGTSQINMSSTSAVNFVGGGMTFNNVSYTGTTAVTHVVIGNNTFNNFTLTAPASAGLMQCTFSANQTITGTLTCAGATAVRRIFLRSDTLGTPRTLTVNSLSAQDCDFRDITIAGAAAGSSPTRAGNCGGNTGITFPAAKTVYWNLAGTQNWSATAWATGSGGTPAVNNFPLAQDTAVFNNTGAAGTVTVQTFNIGTFDASLRTSAVTLTTSTNTPTVYGDWKFGTGVTSSSTTGTITFAARGTETITSNGVTFGCPVTVDCVTGTVNLADALTINSAQTLTLTSGTFDAVTYNVTTGAFSTGNAPLKMGSGTWTLSGTGIVWALSSTNTDFYKGTANILLSNTSTSARSFNGGTHSYNRLTIGGATGTSTFTINGDNQFTELASTKTVAHTIALGTTTQTFGAWTVTGTVGNVVTLTGTGTSHILAGACTSGIDYLAMGSIGFAATSPGEFYAGTNSTGTAAAPVYRTAKPADSTRYWVGGTGNWSDTARWSTSSGGGSGASVPRSHDDVVFDSLSNATAYTAVVNTVTGGIRTKALTIAGPASGNLTLTGSGAIVGIHGNVTLPATGLTRTYSGDITLSGSATGRTLTTNGVALASLILVDGVGAGWVLADALSTSSPLNVVNGSFDTANYNLTLINMVFGSENSKTISLGSSTVTASGTSPINFGTTEILRVNFNFTAGTSQINCSGSSLNFRGNNQTFYNVAFTSTSTGTVTFSGVNTLNNLSVTGITSAGLKIVSVTADQTINGTLTLSAGTNATMRTFVQSNGLGTTRTLTCAAFSGTNADFRDITIAGAAAPVSGIRLGDCKGNSGITFGSGVTRYWNLAAGGNWSATGWAASSGASPSANNFPLAQDTCVFESTGLNSGATITVNAAYNIGTIDMSARTSNTMTLSTGSQQPIIYGNWINGTGTTLAGTNNMTFAGRGSQTITSAGKTFTQEFTVNTPSGSVTLQDAFVNSSASITLTAGTFDANIYNVTSSSTGAGSGVNTTGISSKTMAVGSGTWSIAGGSAWQFSGFNTAVTGTGTISLTSASAKTFAGGGANYSGITLNQGGAGTLTISGNNTFANISNTYKATGATTIAMGTTTQTVGNFTASGEAGRILTVQGTSASSPATLIYTGSGQAAQPAIDYLAITGVRAYNLTDTWYAGANSTNNGSLGWYFEAGGGGAIAVFITESAIANSTESSLAAFNINVSETATASDAQAAGFICLGTLSESATVADAIEAFRAFLASVAESATSSELLSASLTLFATIAELTTGSEQLNTQAVLNAPVSELATMADSVSGGLLFLSNISEATTAQDLAAAVITFNRAIIEAATASEVVSAALTLAAAIISESAQGRESAVAQAILNSLVADSATVSDSAAGGLLFSGNVSEAVAAAESILAGLLFPNFVAESATTQDIAAVVASTFNAASAETVRPLDATQGANTGSPSLSESAQASDAQAAQFTAVTAVAETSTAQETATATQLFVTLVAEAASPADTTSVAPSVFSAVALAAAQAAESFSPAGSIYNAVLPIQGAGITDSLVGAYLWNLIDDTQVPDWGNVVNSQTPAWASVDDTQSVSWQNVTTTQTPGWTDVDDTQTPGWTPITPQG